MINTFNINFSNIKYGWSVISIYKNKKKIIRMAGTGVYNPYYELPNLIKILSTTKKDYKWEVDQEGYYGIIMFKNFGKFLIITTETDKDNKKEVMKKTRAIYLKKQVLREIQIQLISFYNENKKDILTHPFYDFYFDIKELKRIKV